MAKSPAASGYSEPRVARDMALPRPCSVPATGTKPLRSTGNFRRRVARDTATAVSHESSNSTSNVDDFADEGGACQRAGSGPSPRLARRARDALCRSRSSTRCSWSRRPRRTRASLRRRAARHRGPHTRCVLHADRAARYHFRHSLQRRRPAFMAPSGSRSRRHLPGGSAAKVDHISGAKWITPRAPLKPMPIT